MALHGRRQESRIIGDKTRTLLSTFMKNQTQREKVFMLYQFSHVRLFATLWTVARLAPLSMGFSYQSGLPCPPPGDLPNPRIEPTSLMSPALPGGFFTTSAMGEAQTLV